MTVTLRVYRNRAGEWEWRANARNSRIVGASEEGYEHRVYAARKAVAAFPDAVKLFVESEGEYVEWDTSALREEYE